MAEFASHYTYLDTDGTRLFTAVLLPAKDGTFPCVVIRTPYVDALEALSGEEICSRYLNENAGWLSHGYAVVIQHCRGRGKSDGDCIPYINERRDTLALYAFIRRQSFYNGELFLRGSSYLSSVHYCAAPFADDICGAVFGVQDTERYNICYRNGFLKKALHGDWYVGMYRAKARLDKQYSDASFEMLPLNRFTQTVFGEPSADFDEMLCAPHPNDPFWKTHNGGADAHDAVSHIRFPALFTTGFYDIYTGGIFDMWKRMDETARANCALVVSAYDHGDIYREETGIGFPCGSRVEQFGPEYEIAWFDHIRHGGNAPFEKGRITYYSLFENRWHTDDFSASGKTRTLSLGDRCVGYTYDPNDPPRFRGGLSCNFGGGVFQDPPYQRQDIVSIYTAPFPEDTLIKGAMTAKLCVRSDCEDTCFYVRISIETERGDYGLRDDITSLSYQLGSYTPGTDAVLAFRFDEHAFLIRAGQRLRIDIASADAAHYVRHTNRPGLYSAQTSAIPAHNTVDLGRSSLVLPLA